jgi:hypothetical protein
VVLLRTSALGNSGVGSSAWMAMAPEAVTLWGVPSFDCTAVR